MVNFVEEFLKVAQSNPRLIAFKQATRETSYEDFANLVHEYIKSVRSDGVLQKYGVGFAGGINIHTVAFLFACIHENVSIIVIDPRDPPAVNEQRLKVAGVKTFVVANEVVFINWLNTSIMRGVMRKVKPEMLTVHMPNLVGLRVKKLNREIFGKKLFTLSQKNVVLKSGKTTTPNRNWFTGEPLNVVSSGKVSDKGECFITIPTSGSTGEPKLVQHTPETLTAMVSQQRQLLNLTIGSSVLGNKIFMILPALTSGATVISENSSNAVKCVNLLHLFAPNYAFFTVWELYNIVEELTSRGERLPNGTHVITGSGPVPVELLRKVLQLQPHAVTSVYASTEATPIAYFTLHNNDELDGSDSTLNCSDDSAGVGFGNFWGNKVDGINLFVSPHDGELFVQGSHVAENIVGATAESVEGWVSTGDIVHLEGDKIYGKGRKKRMMIRKGRNIYPEIVETATVNLLGVDHFRVHTYSSTLPTSHPPPSRPSLMNMNSNVTSVGSLPDVESEPHTVADEGIVMIIEPIHITCISNTQNGAGVTFDNGEAISDTFLTKVGDALNGLGEWKPNHVFVGKIPTLKNGKPSNLLPDLWEGEHFHLCGYGTVPQCDGGGV